MDTHGKESVSGKAVVDCRRKAKWRLQWERLGDDYGRWRRNLVATAFVAALLSVGLGLGWILGGLRKPSFSYFSDWVKACGFTAFGGEQEINDTTQMYDSLKRWDDPDYNQMDVAANSLFAFPTLFREQMEDVVSRPGGGVRILVLDPRLAEDQSGNNPEGRDQFEKLARQFGQDPFCFAAECRYTGASLIALKKKFGAAFEVRFYNAPDTDVEGGFFLPGRSYQKYNSKDTSKRLDVLVPYKARRPDSAVWGQGVLRVKDRPEHEQVKRFSEAFERVWRKSAPIEELMKDTEGTLHGDWKK